MLLYSMIGRLPIFIFFIYKEPIPSESIVHILAYEGECMKPSRNTILYIFLMGMIIIGILLIFLIDWAVA